MNTDKSITEDTKRKSMDIIKDKSDMNTDLITRTDGENTDPIPFEKSKFGSAS